MPSCSSPPTCSQASSAHRPTTTSPPATSSPQTPRTTSSALIEALVDAPINRTGRFEVLTNGPTFYPAELDAIRSAQHSVNLEAYIFHRSDIGKLYLDALTDRARAGVRVNVVLDAFGSAGVTKRYFRPLLEAGGKLAFYNSPTWYRLLQLDNRTHRELLSAASPS